MKSENSYIILYIHYGDSFLNQRSLLSSEYLIEFSGWWLIDSFLLLSVLGQQTCNRKSQENSSKTSSCSLFSACTTSSCTKQYTIIHGRWSKPNGIYKWHLECFTIFSLSLLIYYVKLVYKRTHVCFLGYK